METPQPPFAGIVVACARAEIEGYIEADDHWYTGYLDVEGRSIVEDFGQWGEQDALARAKSLAETSPRLRWIEDGRIAVDSYYCRGAITMGPTVTLSFHIACDFKAHADAQRGLAIFSHRTNDAAQMAAVILNEKIAALHRKPLAMPLPIVEMPVPNIVRFRPRPALA